MKANDLRRFFAFKTGIFRQLAKKDRLGLRKEYGVTMKLYQPDYYEQFQCTASKCPTTCCMQWRIAVDDETFHKWDDEWKEKVKEVEEGRIIELKNDGMCPFLNEKKLCKIVLRDGEGAISETCHTFPREEHEYIGRVERALTPGCPAVLDLLWKQECFQIQKKEEQMEGIAEEIYEINPVLFEIRDWFLDIVNTREIKLNTTLEICFLIALDLYELEQKGVLEDEFQSYKNTTDIWKIQDAIGENDTITKERLEEYNLLFLDVSQIYREQNIYGDFLVPLAEEAEKINGKETECFKTYQHKINKWAKELRNLFAEEISSAIITPGTGQVLDILVKLEWMAMEYAVLSQALFLQQRKGELTDKKIQKSVCVVFRMMGYADDDIWEYMENCFDSVIWPWEYYSLLV